jgi:ferrous iron transport protein B
VLDLPGAYSLHPALADERVTCDRAARRGAREKRPELVVCVVDATNLRRNCASCSRCSGSAAVLIVALNMVDLGRAARVRIDADASRASSACRSCRRWR